MYTSLEDILGKDTEELTAQAEGEFKSTKLGLIPFTAISNPEYKAAKKSCMKVDVTSKGRATVDLDDDKLKLKIIVDAVDKDKRSNFTFANQKLF
jgi:hypothetical protein